MFHFIYRILFMTWLLIPSKVGIEKLLSVVVDQNLSWRLNMDDVHKTVSILLACFRHVKPFLPTDAWIKFCKASFHVLTTVVQSHEPGDQQIWTDCTNCKKELPVLFLKIPQLPPSLPLLNELKWMTITDRISYHKAVMVYKSLNWLQHLISKICLNL